jgi:hypothetical protein
MGIAADLGRADGVRHTDDRRRDSTMTIRNGLTAE